MTAQQFNDAVEDVLPDPTDERQETVLDLPVTGWGHVKVGDRVVRSVLDEATGDLYVEAGTAEVYNKGLAHLDGDPLHVMRADPVLYQGVPWSRLRVDAG